MEFCILQASKEFSNELYVMKHYQMSLNHDHFNIFFHFWQQSYQRSWILQHIMNNLLSTDFTKQAQKNKAASQKSGKWTKKWIVTEKREFIRNIKPSLSLFWPFFRAFSFTLRYSPCLSQRSVSQYSAVQQLLISMRLTKSVFSNRKTSQLTRTCTHLILNLIQEGVEFEAIRKAASWLQI